MTQIKKMGGVSKFGLTDQGMMDFGKMEWPMGTEDLSMQKETCTRVNGLTTKLMAMAFTPISTEADTRDSGIKTNNMAWVLNSGQTEQNMKECMSKE